MTTSATSPPAFANAEYAARLARVRTELAAHAIDLLLVTSPANLHYLTGYEASWYPPRLPVAVAVWADRDDTLFFDWVRHRDHVEHTTICDEAVYFEYGEYAEVIRLAVDELGGPGTVAIEWSSPSPTAAVINDVAATLRSAGGRVVNGDWIVDDIRLHKSAAEINRIRRASEIVDKAFRGLQRRLRPGMTELEVSALATMLLAQAGGEVPAMPPFVSSGPSAWRDVHAYPSRRRLEAGDLVSVDMSGVVDRYHVNLSRIFALGVEGPFHGVARAWLDASDRSLEAFLRHAQLGDDPAPAMRRAEEVLLAEVPTTSVWWTGGYSLGVAFPPGWVGHAYLANDGPTRVHLHEGFLSNFETVLVDRDRGFEVAPIDTVLMTESGAQRLSTIPRELLVVGEEADRSG